MNRKVFWYFTTLALSLFIVCFAIGRATAIKEGKTEIKENEEQISETSSPNSTVKKFDNQAITGIDRETSKEPTEKPPERMLFPCGEEVLKDYSQDALYSKTMDDWRAHTGIDYKAKQDTEVKACWDGQVIKIYNDKLWGYTVEIIHSGNITSVYKNLDKSISVKEGERVKSGQAIGKVGKSAAVESKDDFHLHFEIWAEGEPINPGSYVY